MAASGKKQQHSDAVWANAFFEKKKKLPCHWESFQIKPLHFLEKV